MSWKCNFHCYETDFLQSDACFSWPWKKLPEGYHHAYDQHQPLNKQQLEHWWWIYFYPVTRKAFCKLQVLKYQSTHFHKTNVLLEQKRQYIYWSIIKHDDPLQYSLGLSADCLWIIYSSADFWSKVTESIVTTLPACLPLMHTQVHHSSSAVFSKKSFFSNRAYTCSFTSNTMENLQGKQQNDWQSSLTPLLPQAPKPSK